MDRAREAIPLAERSGNRRVCAEAYAAVGESCQQWGRFGPDIEYIELAVKIASKEGDLRRLGRYLQLAVMHAAGVGEYERTRQLLDEARTIQRAAKDATLECLLLRAEAVVVAFQEQYERALEMNLAGAERSRRHGLLELEIIMLHNAGDVHLHMGNHKEAFFYFKESLRRSRPARFDRLTEANEMFIGFLQAAWLGLDDGLRVLDAANKKAAEIGRLWNLTQGERLMGEALFARGDRSGAVAHFEEAVRLARESGIRYFIEEAEGSLRRARAGPAQ
jgi:tetratricopeptide (TPR) repeat protein